VRLHVVIPGLVSLFPAVLAWLFSFSPFSILDFVQVWLVFFVAINLLLIVTRAIARWRVNRSQAEHNVRQKKEV
jgi:hypothetical protein